MVEYYFSYLSTPLGDQFGDQFINLLFLHLNNIWRESIYPDQWASSLMQLLYKGDGKDREDQASYRGIFLSNAMLKLFEGILEARLQVFTEKADTLTPSQQQWHDAIYGLLAAVQQQRQSPQKPTQGATPSLGASYCGYRTSRRHIRQFTEQTCK
jgi:hypothetical protein